jgi:uncharacterized membrane protein
MRDRSEFPAATADRVTSTTRAVAVIAAFALIVLSVLWELVLAPTGRGTLVLKALPFALALPGLMRHRMVTYRWLSLAVWLYVAEGVVRVGDRAPAGWLAGLEIVLALVLFTACATQVRWRHAAARRQLAAAAALDDPRTDAGTVH